MSGTEGKSQAATCPHYLHPHGLNASAEQKQVLFYTAPCSLFVSHTHVYTDREGLEEVFLSFSLLLGLKVKNFATFLQ